MGNEAVQGLGAQDGSMDRDEFVIMMGRLLQSGEVVAVVLTPASQKPPALAEEKEGGEELDSKLDEAPVISIPTANAKPVAAAAPLASDLGWMNVMGGDSSKGSIGTDDMDMEPPGGVANWMDVMTAKTEKLAAPPAGGSSWMDAMVGEEERDGDPEQAKNDDISPAEGSAWMNAMGGVGVGAARPEPPKTQGNHLDAMMDAMLAGGEISAMS